MHLGQALKNVIEEYREKGIPITENEVDGIIEHCYRKMEVAGVENREEYLPILFPDEVRNYLFRLSINATTELRTGESNVRNMRAASM